MVMGLQLLFVVYGVLCLTAASATLTIIHLRVSSLGATEAEVQGVVALNLRDQTSHRFSCGSTEGMPQDLVWERADGMAQEFPTMIQGEALMLDLEPPPEEDLGLICRNILTGENKFINVTRGATALCPVKSSETVVLGEMINLRVYADADPPLNSSEIIWTRPNGATVTTDAERFALLDSNKRLRIENTTLEDAGVYRIEIIRMISFTEYVLFAATTIDLDVQGGLNVVDIAESIVYAVPGSAVSILATVYISSSVDPTVSWYYAGDLVNITSNPRYSLSTRDVNEYILTIKNVDVDVLGRYDVVVTIGDSESRNDTVWLTLKVAPEARIVHGGTGDVSSNQLLQVASQQGDPGPIFSCYSDGIAAHSLTWELEGNALPIGVTRRASHSGSGGSVELLWSRRLEFTDTGRYLCTAVNSNGSSTATLDLLVRYPPTIMSIFPSAAVNHSSTSLLTFTVPTHYSGTVATCVGLGWPPPTIEWLVSGQGVLSESTSSGIAAFISARLILQGGFPGSDAVTFSCTIRANDTDLVSTTAVTLEPSQNPALAPTPVPCSVDSRQVYFQIQVQGTDCSTLVSSDFLDTIVSAVNVVCKYCLEDKGIIVEHSCLDQADQAVYRGEITSAEIALTKEVFCALQWWQMRGPLILVNSEPRTVDKNCPARLESPTDPPCPASVEPSITILISVVSATGAIAILLILGLVVVCVCLCRLKRKRNKLEIHSTAARTRTDYDRTYPNSSMMTMTAYNDQNTSLTPTDDNHNYSGLTYKPSTSSPHLSQEFEMNFARNNSQSLLLDGLNSQSSSQTEQTSYQIAVGDVPDASDEMTFNNTYNRPFPDHLQDSPPERSPIGTNNPAYEEVQPKRNPSNLSQQQERRSGASPGVTRANTRGNKDSKEDYSHLDRVQSMSPRGVRRTSKGHTVSSLVISSHQSPPVPHREKRPSASGYSSYSPRLQDSPFSEGLQQGEAPPPYQSIFPQSPLVSSCAATAEYEVIDAVKKVTRNCEMSAEAAQQTTSDQHSSQNGAERPAGDIVPYSVVNKPRRNRGTDAEEYPTEHSPDIPVTCTYQQTQGQRNTSITSPVSQVSKTDLQDCQVANRQLPEIPSRKVISPDQIPEPISTRDIPQRDLQTIPPYSQVNKPKRKEEVRADESGDRLTVQGRQLPDLPTSVVERNHSQSCIQRPKQTILPYSQVSNVEIDMSMGVDEQHEAGLLKRWIHRSCDSLNPRLPRTDDLKKSPQRPRKAIPPYSQVSNSEIDRRARDTKKRSIDSEPRFRGHGTKKRSIDAEPRFRGHDTKKRSIESEPRFSLTRSEPSPYSEPVSGSHKSRTSTGGSTSATTRFKFPSIPGSNAFPYSEPLSRAERTAWGSFDSTFSSVPSPYTEPVSSMGSCKSEGNIADNAFPYCDPDETEEHISGVTTGMRRSLDSGAPNSDNKPLPCSDAMSTDNRRRSDPITQSSSKCGARSYSKPASNIVTSKASA